jgi:methylated-DNA-protein-cysteine methyltransferase related protein
VPDDARAAAILARVRAIPPGHVTTYGDLCPEAPRLAGAVLAACHDPAVPRQRVVRADGSLAKGDEQARLLRGEGTPMHGRRVDIDAAWVDVAALGGSQPRK